MRDKIQETTEPIALAFSRARHRLFLATRGLVLVGTFASLIAGCTFRDSANAVQNWFFEVGARAVEIIHSNYDDRKVPVAQIPTTPSLTGTAPSIVQVSQTPKPLPTRRATPKPSKTPTPKPTSTPTPTETATPTPTATENASEVKLKEVSQALENGLKQLEGKTVLYVAPHHPVEADVCAVLTIQRMIEMIIKQGGYTDHADVRSLAKEMPSLRTSGAIIADYTKGGIMFRGEENYFLKLIGIHNPGPFIVAAPLKGLGFSLDYPGYPSAVGKDISKSQADGFLLLGSYRDKGQYAKALRIWGNRVVVSVVIPEANEQEQAVADNSKVTVYNFVAHTKANTVNRDTVFLQVQEVEINKGLSSDQVTSTIADYITKNAQLPPKGTKPTFIEWLKGFFQSLRKKKN